MERMTGATTTILDSEALLSAARTVLTAQDPALDLSRLSSELGPQMLFAVDGGAAAVVNVEGVGEVAEGDTIAVYFTEGFGVFPVALPVDAVAASATKETIDLADGIRTFGSRLDSNHRRWRSRYSGRYQG